MKSFLRVLPVIALILGLMIIPMSSRALDFGDFSGDSDWGDSGDSWDSDDSWDSGWDSDDSWDSDSGSSRRSRGSSTDLSDPEELEIAMILTVSFIGVCLAAVASLAYIFKQLGLNEIKHTATYPDDQDMRSMDEFRSLHPEFSPQDFKKKLAELYVLFQKEWQRKDISSLRQYLTAPYFAQMDAQLNNYRVNGQTNYVDNIRVSNIDLTGWKSESGSEIIIARLHTRIVDYVCDDRTGALIRGSTTREKLMCYEWTLVRSSSGKSPAGTQICPHCGAKISMNQSAVCEFCGSVLHTDTFDWAVSNIKGISQRTL